MILNLAKSDPGGEQTYIHIPKERRFTKNKTSKCTYKEYFITQNIHEKQFSIWTGTQRETTFIYIAGLFKLVLELKVLMMKRVTSKKNSIHFKQQQQIFYYYILLWYVFHFIHF